MELDSKEHNRDFSLVQGAHDKEKRNRHMTVEIALVHNRYFEEHILIAKDTVPFTKKA